MPQILFAVQRDIIPGYALEGSDIRILNPSHLLNGFPLQDPHMPIRPVVDKSYKKFGQVLNINSKPAAGIKRDVIMTIRYVAYISAANSVAVINLPGKSIFTRT